MTVNLLRIAKIMANAIEEHPEWDKPVNNTKQEIAAILRKYDCLMTPSKEKQLKEELLTFLRKEPK
jgi:hypothetical protein